MNAESKPRITNARARELLALGSHWVSSLADGKDPLTHSEILMVIGYAAGVAVAALPDPKDRSRLFGLIYQLAEHTASDIHGPQCLVERRFARTW